MNDETEIDFQNKTRLQGITAVISKWIQLPRFHEGATHGGNGPLRTLVLQGPVHMATNTANHNLVPRSLVSPNPPPLPNRTGRWETLGKRLSKFTLVSHCCYPCVLTLLTFASVRNVFLDVMGNALRFECHVLYFPFFLFLYIWPFYLSFLSIFWACHKL